MNMKVKAVTAALAAAGIIGVTQSALADTINPTTVNPPAAQSPVPPSGYTVTYPVTVSLTGGTPQTINFVYDGSTGQWTAPAGWSYDASLNPNANTAVFTTTANGVAYGVALSSTGATQFVPSAGTPATTVGPSVGATVTNSAVTSSLSGFGSTTTANGSITGNGQTTGPLVPAPAVAQIIGVGSGGAPVGTVCVDNAAGPPACSAGPIVVNPTTGTSAVGNAGGTITVNSNQPNQSIGWGTYTVAIPTTDTPAGTGTVAGTVAGSSGSVGASGIFLNNITGSASYNTATGVTTANPVQTSTFSVTPNGNTAIGGTLSVAGQTTTNGIANTGDVTTDTLHVNGQSTTHGITNTGDTSTTTLHVTGQSTTNGIANTGSLTTTTLGVSGNATVGGTLGVTGNTTLSGTLTSNGISNTGNISTGSLGVTGNATIGGTVAVTGGATLNGPVTVNNTLTATGATTLGSAAGTGGYSASVSSSGIVLSNGQLGGNNVTVNSAGTSITGGGATLAMANGKATFSGANTAPITVTGIADGNSQYDAVNYGQLDDVKKTMARGIAASGALMNVPQVDQNKTFNLGVGVGGFDGETGWAVGGSLRVAKDGILKASVGGAGGGGSKAVWGVGGAWSFQ
jgi:hypothetical protein